MKKTLITFLFLLAVIELTTISCATSKNLGGENDDLYYSQSDRYTKQNTERSKNFNQDPLPVSSEQNVNNPVLEVRGTRVYKDKILLEKSEILRILSVYPQLENKFNKGANTRGAGVLLIIGGVVIFGSGVALAVSGVETRSSDYYTTTDFNSNYYIGLLIGTIGELMLDGGIACTIVGKLTMRRSVAEYNAKIRKTSYVPGTLNYKVGVLDNGRIGLRLTF